MSSRHDHTPPPTTPPRALCPVCRKAVYSRAGIHPQCAVKLPAPSPADAPDAPAAAGPRS